MSQEVLGYKISVDGEQAKGSVGSFKKELREATQNLIAMNEKFGESSVEARNAAKRVGELKDRISDAKSMAESFNPDARFKSVSQSVQGIAGAFASVQGAMALFGVESQDLQKQLLKVQGALALSEGLNTFLDTGIQGLKNLKAVIIDAFTTLKAQISSTGVGALIIGLGVAVYALYENFDKLTGVTEEATAKNKAYADTLEATNSATTDAIKNVNKVKTAFDEAKTGVLSKKEALKIYNETLGDSLGKTNDIAVAEKKLNDKADDYIKATMLKAQANAMFAMSAKLQAESLTADTKDNVSGMQKALIGLGSALSFGYVGYKDAVKRAQDINTKEIKDNLQKQVETLNAEGKKLLKQSEDIQKGAGIKLDIKTDDKEVKNEKTKQEKIQNLLDEYKLANKKRDEDQLAELDEQLKKEVEANKNANDQIAADDAFARGEKLKADTQVAKNKEELIEKEKALERERFEEALKWATTYTESAQGLSDALYAAKLEGVEKGSKEEEVILRKQFETNKRIQIAQTIISGLNGVVNALAAKSVFLEPTRSILNGINAAMIAATTAATVSKIAQTQFGGTTGNMSVSGGGGGSAPMSPGIPVQQTITQLNTKTINEMGNQAIKAYVVESDITGSQNRVQRILNSSRFK